MFNKHVRFILGEKLLRHGADINLQNKSGKTTHPSPPLLPIPPLWVLKLPLGDTALHYAVRLHREDLVRFALANGAISLIGRYAFLYHLLLDFNLFFKR
jgi:ankyrin repeat protein